MAVPARMAGRPAGRCSIDDDASRTPDQPQRASASHPALSFKAAQASVIPQTPAGQAAPAGQSELDGVPFAARVSAAHASALPLARRTEHLSRTSPAPRGCWPGVRPPASISHARRASRRRAWGRARGNNRATGRARVARSKVGVRRGRPPPAARRNLIAARRHRQKWPLTASSAPPRSIGTGATITAGRGPWKTVGSTKPVSGADDGATVPRRSRSDDRRRPADKRSQWRASAPRPRSRARAGERRIDAAVPPDTASANANVERPSRTTRCYRERKTQYAGFSAREARARTGAHGRPRTSPPGSSPSQPTSPPKSAARPPHAAPFGAPASRAANASSPNTTSGSTPSGTT